MNPGQSEKVKSTDRSPSESGQNKTMAPPPPSRSKHQHPPDPQPIPKFITALYIILLSSLVFLLLQRYAIHGSIFPWPWHPLITPVSAITVVDTGYAQYRGEQSYANAVAYLGIPYAEPPVGDRRFRAPLPLNTTRVSLEANGVVVDATGYPEFCVQGVTGSKI
jgi:Carboxylesterase family